MDETEPTSSQGENITACSKSNEVAINPNSVQPDAESSELKQDPGTSSGDVEEMSHREAMLMWKEGLAAMIENDPLLMDLHSAVTVDEINAQIALEYGQAMTVNVKRADDDTYPIVVMQNATVYDLKQAIKRHVNLRQTRENGIKFISWQFIWQKYWLVFDGERLSEEHKSLKEYGIRNKAEVTFMRRLREI